MSECSLSWVENTENTEIVETINELFALNKQAQAELAEAQEQVKELVWALTESVAALNFYCSDIVYIKEVSKLADKYRNLLNEIQGEK